MYCCYQYNKSVFTQAGLNFVFLLLDWLSAKTLTAVNGLGK